MSILNTVVNFIAGGSKVESSVVATALTTPKPVVPVPDWLQGDLKAGLTAKFEGCTVVCVGGRLDGSAPMALAHVVAKRGEAGRTGGNPLFADADEHNFGWVAAQPKQKGKRFDPRAFVTELDPATGDDLNDCPSFPTARIKFKLEGKSSISAWSALADLQAYLETPGDNSFRDYVVLLQLDGQPYEEVDPNTKAKTGNWTQPVTGWAILELPSFKAEATFSSLPLAPKPVEVEPRRGKAPKAVLADSLVEAAVRGEVPVAPVVVIATGDSL